MGKKPQMKNLPAQGKDGRFHYYWTQDGFQRHVSAATQMDCVMSFYRRYQDIEDGLVDINPNTPVRVWCDRWFSTYKVHRKMTDKSRGDVEAKLRLYILPRLGNLSIRKVTQLHLQEILNEHRDRSLSTLKKVRCVMGEVFGKAYELGYIPRNPAAGLELPDGSANKRRSLTPLERWAFDDMVREGRHRGCLFYSVMLLCGLRPGECAALQWQHIDFDKGIIHVKQAKESSSKAIKGPKTASGVRDVPVPPELLERLRQGRNFPTNHVFLRAGGTPHTDSSLYHMWESWRKQMDRRMACRIIDQIRASETEEQALFYARQLSGDFVPEHLVQRIRDNPTKKTSAFLLYRNMLVIHGEPQELLNSLVAYDLRHTYCTNLQKLGIDLKTASYLMGHADIAITANIYSHVDADMVANAGRKIAGA